MADKGERTREETDYRRYAVLYVDDEEQSLKYFERIFGQKFRVLTACTAVEGFRVFKEHAEEIGLLITDERMPGEKGVRLLERVREFKPLTVRILVTAFSDLDAAVRAVNTGAIFKYVSKPWDVRELEVFIRSALDYHLVQVERDMLMRDKLSKVRSMMITDRVITLGVAAAGLGHYVRNSLVAVRTFLDLAPLRLQEEIEDKRELRNQEFWLGFYGHVQTQVERISKLLSGLGMVHDGMEAPPVDTVQLGTVIREVNAALEGELTAKGIRSVLRIPAELPAIVADRDKITRLFELLMRDEIITLPVGSSITVSATDGKSISEGIPAVRVRVFDNGPGLSEDALRSVFDPFFVRSETEMEFGINLISCYFIVYHHGGTISVANRSRGGAVFEIMLPLAADARSPVDEENAFISRVVKNEDLWGKIMAGT